jgi:ornithine--oxo-acid transaminase
MDMLAAYSAVNFGHGSKELIAAAKAQLDKVTLTSRAFQNDQLGPWCKELAELCGMEAVLPMNTGAEGVETAIKTARKWAYKKKGVLEGKARIICCENNFHGRTTTIVSFSTDPNCREGFGPFTPGFEVIPYGDIDALRKAIDDNAAAFLVEPIQGEAGIIIPPEGFLKQARQVCQEHDVLFIADEIQSGLGRTGKTFCVEHEGVRPDIFILGKALGGGIMPLSAIVSTRDILSVFKPGNHDRAEGHRDPQDRQIPEERGGAGRVPARRASQDQDGQDQGNPRAGSVDRDRVQARGRRGAQLLREAHAGRHALQGHPRADHAPGPAAVHHQGRA